MLSKTKSWQKLHQLQQRLAEVSLAQLFQTDPQRFDNFSISLDDILLDFSKQHIDQETWELLVSLAEESDLFTARHAMFTGVKINLTENRPVLHVELRNPNSHLPE